MRTVSGTGEPGFVCHQKDGDVLILAIEIKSTHILNNVTPDQTLHEVYEGNAKVRMVIQQLYNYLSENELKYGILSTYDCSWFVKREHRCLYISNSLGYDSTYPPVLKTYTYLAQQAIDNVNGHHSPHANIIPQADDSQCNSRKRRYDDPSSRQPPSGKSQLTLASSSKESSSSTSGKTSGKQAMEAQSFKYGDFKYTSILSVGENKKEVEIYRVLAKLQGVYIPELLFYGDLAEGMSFVMGLSIVGPHCITIR
ncbi:7817_t:CDS:2 [Paraglomus brasilianum]|uniref:7817_t:CDS:1 n=1 Tax=Paraglomus brasilianum TaxID=144538 RepID=A0A9N9E6L6_9GLOM|nr:7817_t:CDS:2 [Paraglomus brasilianum]